jgi:hypothetical protein
MTGERQVRPLEVTGDRVGGESNERPVTFGEVFATLCHDVGVDLNKVTVQDLAGRSTFLISGGCQIHAPPRRLDRKSTAAWTMAL